MIVFVHGIGDHCPGYALDTRLGWFSSDVVKAVGLTPVSPEKTDRLDIPDFDNNDWKSTLVLQRKRYTVDVADHQKRVDAVEITWSGLDRWLKDNQLGYDISKVRLPSLPPEQLKRGDEILDCVEPVGGKFSQRRVRVNEALKDGLLDRNLADAVIYAGSYGPAIEHGVADAMCRILKEDWSPDREKTPCDWATIPVDNTTQVMFVTHSLGSRIVYDTMLELYGKQMRPGGAVFPPGVVDAARPAMHRMLQNTTAIYMMANQLPLLGLADARPEMTSEDGSARLLKLASAIRVASAQSQSSAEARMQSLEKQRQDLTSAMEKQPDPLIGLAWARKDAMKYTPVSVGTLDIVAFSDANDLLSYSLPDLYGSELGDADVRVTNVFVHNAVRWFWLLENPVKAHGGYMTNNDVWRAIACGASNEVRPSCDKGH
jgi:hypothetical protein